MKIYNSADELIGKTPLLRLNNIEKLFNLNAKIFAKLEFLNPAGSIKDRVAKSMIDDAEKRGKLRPGSVIIEPTSGNTGIGLAAVAAARGYKVIIVMPDSMSKERILVMKALGAEVVLTDGTLAMQGAIDKAKELAEQIPNSFIAGQFDNPANPNAHYQTTGPEIFDDMDGDIDILVAGIGTGGTISGIGKYLKEQNAEIKVVGVEPESSPFFTSGKTGSHGIQGIGAGFMPQVFDSKVVDEILTVSDNSAFELCKAIGKTEGILVGISSAAALKSAIDLARREENKDKNIVVIFPDTGDRYLSSGIFD